MIRISLTRAGGVGVRATKANELVALKKLKYLRFKERAKVGVTWWTYLTDLRRDIPSKRIIWDDSVKKNLKHIVGGLKRAKTGNNNRVYRVFRDHMRPYDFQLAGIHFALNTKRCLIADDTGLGKTIQTIGTMLTVLNEDPNAKALLLVPSGLKFQWYEQIQEFIKDSCIPEEMIIVNTTKKKRIDIYRSNWRLLIMSPEILRLDYQQLRPCLNNLKMVALDEASIIRNEESKISRVMRFMFPNVEYKLALTATPIENKLHDLFSIFQFVDHRVFFSKPYFEKRYIIWRISRFKVKNKKGQEFRVAKREPRKYIRLNEVKQKIAPAYIRRTVSDVSLELPGLVVSWEKVNLPKKQMDVYNACKEEEQLKGMRKAAIYSWLQGLRQVCNSTELVMPNEKKPTHAKVKRIKELLDTELHGEQVIIFSDYEKFVQILARELKKYKVATFTGKGSKRRRFAEMEAFKAGHKRVLICTSAGERGHNLQNAAVIINVDLPFNPAALKQRLGRSRRIGAKHSVTRMINFIALGTIEESIILRKIYGKRDLFEKVFEGDELTKADPIGRIGDNLGDYL